MSQYVFAVKDLAIENGDTSIYRLAKRLNVHDKRAGQLWRGVTRIHQDTVALICDAYDCTPNDFIRKVPSAKAGRQRASKKTTHP